MMNENVASALDLIPTYSTEVVEKDDDDKIPPLKKEGEEKPRHRRINRVSGKPMPLQEHEIFTDMVLGALYDQMKIPTESDHIGGYPMDWPEMSEEMVERLKTEPMFRSELQLFMHEYGFFHQETFDYEHHSRQMPFVMGWLSSRYKNREVATVPTEKGRKVVFHKPAYEALCRLFEYGGIDIDGAEILADNYCSYCRLIQMAADDESDTLKHLDFTQMHGWYRQNSSHYRGRFQLAPIDFEDFYRCLSLCKNPIQQHELWLYEIIYLAPQDKETKHLWIRGLNAFLPDFYKNDTTGLIYAESGEEPSGCCSLLSFRLDRFDVPDLYWYLRYFGEHEEDTDAYYKFYRHKVRRPVHMIEDDTEFMDAIVASDEAFELHDRDELKTIFPMPAPFGFDAHWAYLLLDDEQRVAFWSQRKFWRHAANTYMFDRSEWYHVLKDYVLPCAKMGNIVPKMKKYKKLYPGSPFCEFFEFLELPESQQQYSLNHGADFLRVFRRAFFSHFQAFLARPEAERAYVLEHVERLANLTSGYHIEGDGVEYVLQTFLDLSLVERDLAMKYIPVFRQTFSQTTLEQGIEFIRMDQDDRRIVIRYAAGFAEIASVFKPKTEEIFGFMREGIDFFRAIEPREYQKGDAKRAVDSFGKVNITPRLMFAYLKLDEAERGRFETELDKRRSAMVAESGRIVDTAAGEFPGLVFSVLSRVDHQKFCEGVAKVDFDAIPELDPVFGKERKVEVPLFIREEVDKEDELLAKGLVKKMLKYGSMKNDSLDVFRESNAAIRQAVEHMAQHPKLKNSEPYKSLSEYLEADPCTESETLLVALIELQQEISRDILVPFIVRIFLAHLGVIVPHIFQALGDFEEDAQLVEAENRAKALQYMSLAPILIEFFNEIREQAENIDLFDSEGNSLTGDLIEMVSEFFRVETISPKLEQAIEASPENLEPKSMTLWIAPAARNELDCFYEKDTCSNGPEEVMNPQFQPLRLLNEDKTAIVGFIWCVTENHPEYGKTLVLTDIQPDLELRGKYRPESLLDQVIEHLDACCVEGGYDTLMMTTETSALSNDVLLCRVMKQRLEEKDTVQLSTISKIPTNSGTDISKCVVLKQFNVEEGDESESELVCANTQE